MRSVLGVTAALAVCCTVHLIILAGGVGAAAGVLGGALHSPYVVVGGLVAVTVALGVFFINRGGDPTCCPPDTDDKASR